jgi:hypothetical protein
VNLLQTFAGQSVLAIQNARLFREIEEKGRQLEIAGRLCAPDSAAKYVRARSPGGSMRRAEPPLP